MLPKPRLGHGGFERSYMQQELTSSELRVSHGKYRR